MIAGWLLVIMLGGGVVVDPAVYPSLVECEAAASDIKHVYQVKAMRAMGTASTKRTAFCVFGHTPEK